MKRLGKPAFNRLGFQGLPYGFGSPNSRSYIQKVLRPNPGVGYDPSSLILYHPMNESAGGVAIDYSPEGNDGAYAGVTLGQPGIGDGLTCPLFGGINDLNNIYSVALNADFNGAEGTLLTWGRVFNVGVWTDNVYRALAMLRVDGTNYVQLYKSGGAGNPLVGYYNAAGSNRFISIDIEPLTFYTLGITWSAAADEVRVFYNGVQQGATLNGIGIWAGNLAATRTVIGDNSTGNLWPWSGWLAHGLIYNAPQPPTSMAYLGIR